MANFDAHFFRRHFRTIVFIGLLLGGAALYTRAITSNPAGFYFDESSIAYNAHLIAQTGRDEHGEAWPLFFTAFGDYKNPVYIYLLALLFKVTGPGILVARLLSAAAGLFTAVLLALLSTRVAHKRSVGLLVMLTALLTPWFFELSRVVVEVALYPALIALFLLLVYRAFERQQWSWLESIAIAISLALITYTYSIGRVLGPLFALGLVLFVTRARFWFPIKTWLVFALTLIPMIVFHQRHPDGLLARYKFITFVTPKTSYADDAAEFVKRYVANINAWKMVVSGDPNGYQIASVYHAGPFLLGALLLLAVSLFLLTRSRQLNAWWRFVLFGLAVSFVPASLTLDYFHTLRLSPVPVFLVVLTIPALAWLTEKQSARRKVLLGVLALMILQSAFFQWHYHQSASLERRLNLFDADYNTTVLPLAMSAAGSRPIYLADTQPIPGYIQALWYATLDRIPLEKMVRLPPDASAPEGAAVITTEDTCPRCEILYKRWPYMVYIAKGPARVLAPLPASGCRAEIRALDYPSRLAPKETATIRVVIKNLGDVTWWARERSAEQYQISLGNHWLNPHGEIVINDDGRTVLLDDLSPGKVIDQTLTINAPRTPGDYILELDMLQENVSWFGLRGSQTLRMPVKVE